MIQHQVIETARHFAGRMTELIDVLPQDFHGKVISEQLRQAGAQLRLNAEPTAEGALLSGARLGAVERYSGECAHLIHLAIMANLVRSQRADDLVQEARDLSALALTSRKALRKKAGAA